MPVSYYYAYVGCRTTRERNARGRGIDVYRVDGETGRWKHVQLVPDLLNPSFLAFGRDKRFLYTVHGDGSEVSAFAVDAATGRLTDLNRQSTQGRNPVHLALDPSCCFMVVCNHLTSTLAVLPVHEGGTVGEVCDLVTLAGPPGPHRTEQPFSKPHQAVFAPDRRFVVVPDKGLDRVFTFSLDPHGKLSAAEQPFVPMREGAGPRHVAFLPNGRFVFVLNELDSTIVACRYETDIGALVPIQVLSTLPQNFTGNSRASEIEVSADGRFVYTSNRGHDSIAIFAVDPVKGWLSLVDTPHTGGMTPRFFALAPGGQFMHVANENSDAIVTFAVDQSLGTIVPTAELVYMGSPVCILHGPSGALAP